MYTWQYQPLHPNQKFDDDFIQTLRQAYLESLGQECTTQDIYNRLNECQLLLMMRSYGYFGSLYPFEADYSTGEGYKVMDYLLEHIPQVKYTTNLVRDKGLCRSIYNSGRLGDYKVNVKRGIEKQLAEWGFNRDNGDALIVIARLPLNADHAQTSSADFLHN